MQFQPFLRDPKKLYCSAKALKDRQKRKIRTNYGFFVLSAMSG